MAKKTKKETMPLEVEINRSRVTTEITVVRLDCAAMEIAIVEYVSKVAGPITTPVEVEVDFECSDYLPSATVTFTNEKTEEL